MLVSKIFKSLENYRKLFILIYTKYLQIDTSIVQYLSIHAKDVLKLADIMKLFTTTVSILHTEKKQGAEQSEPTVGFQ